MRIDNFDDLLLKAQHAVRSKMLPYQQSLFSLLSLFSGDIKMRILDLLRRS